VAGVNETVYQSTTGARLTVNLFAVDY